MTSSRFSPVRVSASTAPASTSRPAWKLELAARGCGLPMRSSTVVKVWMVILGFFRTRSIMIFEARNSSRRWMRCTRSTSFERYEASSMAESPPPTTATVLRR